MQETTLYRYRDLESDHVSRWLWLIAPLALAPILILLAHTAPDFYARWLDDETRGVLSHIQVVVPALAFVVAVRMLWLRPIRDQPWLFAWIAIAALGCFYIAGEEASWGQHYLGWVTPAGWSTLNDQGETNLHNVSSWFDQKPRQILEVGVVVGGILVPIYACFRPRLRRYWFAIILPPAIGLPTALLAEIAMGSERLLGLFDGNQFLFSRAAEVQETYFYWFVLLYLIVLDRRVRALDD